MAIAGRPIGIWALIILSRLLLPMAAMLMLGSTAARADTVNIVFIGDSITYGAGLQRPERDAPPVIATERLRASMPDLAFSMSNQGRGGHTTVDTLPSSKTDFPEIRKAAQDLLAASPGELVFSLMLGANDSARGGPTGSPVDPVSYQANLRQVISGLLAEFPASRVVVHHPLWYSPNTDNGVQYLADGLARLESYRPQIDRLVARYACEAPNRVFLGDTAGFQFFRRAHRRLFQAEPGRQGTFYLHPNERGSVELGKMWAKALRRVIVASRKAPAAPGCAAVKRQAAL